MSVIGRSRGAKIVLKIKMVKKRRKRKRKQERKRRKGEERREGSAIAIVSYFYVCDGPKEEKFKILIDLLQHT